MDWTWYWRHCFKGILFPVKETKCCRHNSKGFMHPCVVLRLPNTKGVKAEGGVGIWIGGTLVSPLQPLGHLISEIWGPAGIWVLSKRVRKLDSGGGQGTWCGSCGGYCRFRNVSPAFLHSPILPLGQHSWGTGDHWWIYYEKVWLSCIVETFVRMTEDYSPLSKWWFCLLVWVLLSHFNSVLP